MNKQLDKKKLTDFLQKYNIELKDYKYYEIAFSHPSFYQIDSKKNINSNNKISDLFKQNQRFEYLGDTVYLFIINLYLFDLKINVENKYIDLSDKQMSHIKEYFISGKFQAKLARELNFSNFIIGYTSKLNLNDDIYEDVFESFICALYKDQGFDVVKNFINKVIFKSYPIILDNTILNLENQKAKINNINLENKTNKIDELLFNYEKQPMQAINNLYSFIKKTKPNPKKNIGLKDILNFKNKLNFTILTINGVEFSKGKNKKEAVINTIKLNKDLLIKNIYENI